MFSGRTNPRQMQRILKQYGIQVEEIEDVLEVIIRTVSKEYIFKNPSVTLMIAQGQRTFQIIGNPEIKEKEEKIKISSEDIKLVSKQANVSEEQAKKALEECDGNPAEAIIKLMK